MPTPTPLASITILGVLARVFRQPLESQNIDIVRRAVADEPKTPALIVSILLLLIITPPRLIRLLPLTLQPRPLRRADEFDDGLLLAPLLPVVERIHAAMHLQPHAVLFGVGVRAGGFEALPGRVQAAAGFGRVVTCDGDHARDGGGVVGCVVGAFDAADCCTLNYVLVVVGYPQPSSSWIKIRFEVELRTLSATSTLIILRHAFRLFQPLADVDCEGGVDDARWVFSAPVDGVRAVEGAEVEGFAVDDGLVAGDRVGGGEGWEEEDEGLEE